MEESPEWFWLHTRLLNTVGSLSETYIPPHQELYYQRTSSSANRTVVSVVRKTSSFDTGYKNRGLLYFNVELSDFVSLTDSLNLYPDMETVILTDTGRVIHDSSGASPNRPAISRFSENVHPSSPSPSTGKSIWQCLSL